MEIDVSAWAVIRDEPGGRDKNKKWLAEDADARVDQHWLWKHRQTTGNGSEAALTDCAEVFTSRLAAEIGLPAAKCSFATLHGELGLISHNVTPAGFDLHPGAAYLPEIEGYERQPPPEANSDDGGRMRREEGYTLDAVQQVLTDVQAPPGISDHSGFDVFAGYLVLDALIGNGDRHPGNWAILERQRDGARFLAPTYDHGSALGAGLTTVNRRDRDPVVFARKGRANPFTPRKQLLLDLALQAVARSGADVWVERVAALGLATIRETLEAPKGRLSEVASTFIERVVIENQRRLSHGNGA